MIDVCEGAGLPENLFCLLCQLANDGLPAEEVALYAIQPRAEALSDRCRLAQLEPALLNGGSR